jgi:hypothetical protein
VTDLRLEERTRRAAQGVPIFPVRTVTTSETVRESDAFLLVDATAGAVTLTLPKADTMKGRLLWVKLMDNTGAGVTVDGNGSETIDGATTKVWVTQYECYTVCCTGTAWVIV